MYCKLIFLLLCIASLWYIPVEAQQAYFQEEEFPSQVSGIKHVSGIAADKNNCIWFATQAGVYRYDGTRFKHYSVLNSPVLQFARMDNMTLRINRQGYSWYLTDTKTNLYEVDSLSRIQPYRAKAGTDDQIIYEKYSQHIPDPQKNSIAASFRGNIFETYILPATQKVFLVLLNGNIVSMSNSDFLSGRTGDVLYSLKGNLSYNGHYGTKAFATKKNFYAITASGLIVWEGEKLKSRAVNLSGDILNNDNKSIDHKNLSAIKTSNPDLILFWYGDNIYEAVESGDNKTLNTRLLIKGTGNELPITAYYSPDQQLFISYYFNKGLVFYRPRQFSLLTANSQNLTDYYYSVIPTRNGFTTSINDGIIWFDTKGQKKILSSEHGINKYYFFNDLLGNTWYQDVKSFVVSYLQAGTGKSVPLLQLDYREIMTGIYQADHSSYYLLSNFKLRKIVVKEQLVTSTKILADCIGRDEFTILFALSPNILWLGSDKGLFEYSISNNSCKKVNDIGDVYVRSAIRLSENNFLLGTYDKGIYQFNNGKWNQLRSSEKNLPASAHAFIIDRLTSSLWVSSNEGIIRLSLNQLSGNADNKNNISFSHFTNFGPDISTEFNGSSNISGAKLADTCIAFANAKGLVMFNPLKLVSYPLPVRVLVEPISEPMNDSLSTKKISSRHVEFNAIVPYYGSRDDLEVLYRLTNSDDEWHKLSPNAVINYNNLKPGDHTLQFHIRHYHDTTGKTVLLSAKTFSISYRWYERTGFIVVAGLLVLLIVISLHYVRTWYIIKKRKELEKLVKTRTVELQESNENLVHVINDLSASEKNLRQSNFLKDEYYAVLTHDLRSPLKFLSFYISQLLDLLSAPEHEVLKKDLFAAYECSNDVTKMIDEFIYWIQENENQLVARPSIVLINRVIEDVKKIYGFSMEGNKNTFVSDIPKDLTFTTDPKLLFIVLRNAIDNANKYTHNGTITVSAIVQNENLRIEVADNGSGMNEDLIKALTELQYKDDQVGYKERKSLGFYIMAMLIKKIGGHYIIDSVKGKGTNLSFSLPMLKTK